MISRSGRSALKRRDGCLIHNAGEPQYLYRAMAWLGEELNDDPPEEGARAFLDREPDPGLDSGAEGSRQI